MEVAVHGGGRASIFCYVGAFWQGNGGVYFQQCLTSTVAVLAAHPRIQSRLQHWAMHCPGLQDCRLRSNGQYGLHVAGQGSAATCLRVELLRNDDYAVLVRQRSTAQCSAG